MLDSKISNRPSNITNSTFSPASCSAPSILKSLVRLTNLLNIDINLILLSENCIKPFVYKDSITEDRPVVAIRPSVSNNLRFYCFIINASLNNNENCKYFKVVKGSNLSLRAAAGMLQDKEINFNVRMSPRTVLTYIYIYMCVCVCVCVCWGSL